MPELLIVADDLSGAADCAVGCTLSGLETIVLLEPSPVLATRSAAVAVDVDSRNMQPDHAGRTMGDAVRRMHGPDARVIYHKIDSTLRGNWATELVHARRAIGESAGQMPLAIVTPAFPSLGRSVSHGQVAVRGIPLSDTEIWNGANKTDAGDVPAPLHRMGLRVGRLDLGEVRRGPNALTTSFCKLATAGIEVAVCDAETDHDLFDIALGSLAAGIPALWGGSGGLMRQLARALGKPTARAAIAPAQARGPLLFVVGSASAVSHGQFERLAENPDVTPIRIAPDVAVAGTAPAELMRRLQSAIAAGKDVAVLVERGNAIDPRHGAALPPMLAALVAPRLSSFGGLFATGGETARAILKAAGVAGIKLGGEVEPGVPWGLALGDGTLYIITKAGAFGDTGTLVRAHHALKRLTAGHAPHASAVSLHSAGTAP